MQRCTLLNDSNCTYWLTGEEPMVVDFLLYPFMYRTNVVLEQLFNNTMMRDDKSDDVAALARWLTVCR